MVHLQMAGDGYAAFMVAVIIEKGLAASTGERLSEWMSASHIALVCDDNTHRVMAEAMLPSMLAKYKVKLIHLGHNPKADLALADDMITQAKGCDGMLAVGSGTINDLCKYASHRMGIGYIACATAPSMNGYVSSTASLHSGVLKQSFNAHQPKAVLADLDVISGAPSRLIKSGLGDTLCRSTVQADWMLSHQLLGTPYDASLFDELLPLEAELIANANKLTEKDPALMHVLMQALVASGMAMHRAGSSAPASQSEHMVAHAYELLYGSQVGRTYHGEQIAVTTLAMAKVQDKLILKQPVIKPTIKKRERFEHLFGVAAAEALHTSYMRKAIDAQKAEQINDSIAKDWPQMREAIESVRAKSSTIENALRLAGCPMRHSDLRWDKDRFEHVMTYAYLTRDRFTFLDLAAMDKRLRFAF